MTKRVVTIPISGYWHKSSIWATNTMNLNNSRGLNYSNETGRRFDELVRFFPRKEKIGIFKYRRVIFSFPFLSFFSPRCCKVTGQADEANSFDYRPLFTECSPDPWRVSRARGESAYVTPLSISGSGGKRDGRPEKGLSSSGEKARQLDIVFRAERVLIFFAHTLLPRWKLARGSRERWWAFFFFLISFFFSSRHSKSTRPWLYSVFSKFSYNSFRETWWYLRVWDFFLDICENWYIYPNF